MLRLRTKSGRFSVPRLAGSLLAASAVLLAAALFAAAPVIADPGGHHDDDDKHKKEKKIIVKRIIERRIVEREFERDFDRDDRYQDRRLVRRLSPVNGACNCAGYYWIDNRPYAVSAAHNDRGGYALTGEPAYAYGPSGAAYTGEPAHARGPAGPTRYGGAPHGLSGPAAGGYGGPAGHADDVRVVVTRYPAGGGYAAPAYPGGGRVPTSVATAPWEPHVDGGSVVGVRPPGVYHENGATVIVNPPIVVPYGTLPRHYGAR